MKLSNDFGLATHAESILEDARLLAIQARWVTEVMEHTLFNEIPIQAQWVVAQAQLLVVKVHVLHLERDSVLDMVVSDDEQLSLPDIEELARDIALEEMDLELND